ncbi:Hypothetical protein DEACI_0214 [Acididesulfobacillus acetoxydans]|uniref:Uncharacterized protein n=1 Tax=Acididesulfobacillus acetoxydans TaxID=1561005 RepID=A0A8S0W1N1_9FIRM|nr:hypothetical protein [Acididesulfobacillus acetoxydans]CAA7599588.1 Hypothetical protein DEACI_0214 [Acididesulfobacillus acetoxydans]CEJ07783.1 Hypothetical protein DEACI_2249 [Acididesulfobacillus acetoxydans]
MKALRRDLDRRRSGSASLQWFTAAEGATTGTTQKSGGNVGVLLAMLSRVLDRGCSARGAQKGLPGKVTV